MNQKFQSLKLGGKRTGREVQLEPIQIPGGISIFKWILIAFIVYVGRLIFGHGSAKFVSHKKRLVDELCRPNTCKEY